MAHVAGDPLYCKRVTVARHPIQTHRLLLQSHYRAWSATVVTHGKQRFSPKGLRFFFWFSSSVIVTTLLFGCKSIALYFILASWGLKKQIRKLILLPPPISAADSRLDAFQNPLRLQPSQLINSLSSWYFLFFSMQKFLFLTIPMHLKAFQCRMSHANQEK